MILGLENHHHCNHCNNNNDDWHTHNHHHWRWWWWWLWLWRIQQQQQHRCPRVMQPPMMIRQSMNWGMMGLKWSQLVPESSQLQSTRSQQINITKTENLYPFCLIILLRVILCWRYLPVNIFHSSSARCFIYRHPLIRRINMLWLLFVNDFEVEGTNTTG